jgi:bifunctional non-homologous end joining protein LigD
MGMILPRVQPIIPTWRKEPFDDPEWLFDFKYDGFRGLCYIEQGRCRLLSRNGKVLSRFSALGDELAAILQIDEAIIDGEVVAAAAVL